MLSVGQFAKLAQVSARTLRYYESIGLIEPASRSENNYRYYNQELLQQIDRIRDLQSLGFSLEEVKDVLSFSNSDLNQRLKARLVEVTKEMSVLTERRERLEQLLSVVNKVELGEIITDTERALYMEAFRNEIIDLLEQKYENVTETQLTFLKRDLWLEAHPQMKEFIEAVKKCVEFAKKNNLSLGHGRGSGPASITLFGLGLSSIDPVKYDLIPERLSTRPPNIHIDVEFERGQMFVDYCNEITKSLSVGQIHAFKMPLLDIIKSTHKSIGKEINYNLIDENSDSVLDDLRNGDVEKIFNFDFSENSLIMKYENQFPEYAGLKKISEYLRGQKIYNFRDIINITALWRPHSQEILDRIHAYSKNKSVPFRYSFLDESLQKYLEPNFGMIIYHEDIMRIMSHYTGWDYARCNALRVSAFNKVAHKNSDWNEFQKLAPAEVVTLVLEESKWSFCQPHAIAFAEFTKQTAVLKNLHKDAYYKAIEEFEKKHEFTWDDIGIRIKGVSLLQH